MRSSNRSVAVFGVFVVAAGLLFAQRVSGATRPPTVIPSPTLDVRDATAKTETAVFAGGCFWGIQSVFQHIKGVTSATSGYAGGWTDKPELRGRELRHEPATPSRCGSCSIRRSSRTAIC